jgi:plastocyanin
LANVIVHIVGGLPKRAYPVPTTPVELTQQGCQYAPHVFGIRAGQPLKVLNPDAALHNVKTMSKINPPFNMSMISSVKEKTVVFDKPEFVVPIQCDVHPWMGAYCAVMDNPYFAVSGKDGAFTIPELVAGTYEVDAWHEKLGVQKMTVQVGKDEKKTIDFTFTKPSK